MAERPGPPSDKQPDRPLATGLLSIWGDSNCRGESSRGLCETWLISRIVRIGGIVVWLWTCVLDDPVCLLNFRGI